MILNVWPEGQIYYNWGVFAFEFAAAVAQLAGIAGIKAGRAAYVMFKSTYPSISGSRYLKKDTH